jgi:hypothetical protein
MIWYGNQASSIELQGVTIDRNTVTSPGSSLVSP